MNTLIAAALKQRVLVLVLMLAVFAGGAIAFRNLNIEAYPDPVPPLVDIIVQSPGQSAEEMERYMTIPVEIQMAGIPNVTAIRTISLFGLSDIKVQFTYDFTYQQAEQWVTNRLSQLPPLPNGASPQISPESPVGEIMRYRVVGPPGYSVMDLKTIQDWMLERRFKAVPGVVDVNGWGGKTKAYNVTIDQRKLQSYGLTVPQVITALNNANINVGGQTVNFGAQSAVVRGIGLIHSMDQIADTMVSQNNGAPVFVRDVARVEVGHLPRLGIAGQDDTDDIVQGIVLMRRGAESLPTIRRVEALIDRINHSGILPPGVRIERIYDRSDLINVTTHTVLHNMVEGILLIFLVQWIFLGNLRAACITAATIPFALAFAITLLLVTGESANLLSVGAIDFGLVVDATVILVENVVRRLAQPPAKRFASAVALHRSRVVSELGGKFAVIGNAAIEVNRGIFFSAAIIIAGFVPLFTMSGIEGHIFGPMARTYAYAIAGGLIATFTVTPALSALLLRAQETETETLPVRLLHRLYRPVVRFALANRLLTLGLMLCLLLSAGLAVRTLGMEFLPKLEEGNMWVRATMPTSVSLQDSNGDVNRMRAILKSFPEVVTVVSQHGRPDDGTDATGFFNAEFFVPLKPFGTWPPGMDKEKLTEAMTRRLQDAFPG
ncbi:MAG TPA: efflux RND transporter permease subunit, partial [Rhodopila sp.]|nr:efflux RND transporter permease subunit [Rhodopila sp.]